MQVRQSEGNVIIYTMDVRVDGSQYKYVRQFTNGTRVYETYSVPTGRRPVLEVSFVLSH